MIDTMIFVKRFILAGKATERKIIRTGIATKNIAIVKKTYEILNTKTFPAKISFKLPGIYR
jgi:hypothetical protein